MGVRFSKSIKIGNLIKLNISKSGISATIGKKGASINIGGKGTYLNLSPAIAGILGTGVTYRKKITGGLGSLIEKVTGKEKNNDEQEIVEGNIRPVEEKKSDEDIVNQYQIDNEANINIHKYADKVLSKDAYDEKINQLDLQASKEIYQLSIDGDEDTIESLVGSFMANLELAYDAKATYELEDHDLYVDLDLPEIENISDKYPVISKGEITYKKKTQVQLREDYSQIVMSLGVFLSASFFNISSYIDTIIMSAFTTRRNNDGDCVDDYLYSVKFKRDEFVDTDLNNLEDLYNFLLKFENRINFNSTSYSFKSIKPYEMPTQEKANSLINDALAGLKELGYRNADINNIIPKLNELNLQTSGEYLKEALKLLSEKA